MFPCLIFLIVICLLCGTAQAGIPTPVTSWANLIDAIKDNQAAEGARKQFIDQARQASKLEVIRRVYKYEDIGKHRSWLDGRAKPLEPEIQQTFALSMSDYNSGYVLMRELPMLAAAYRLTNEKVFLDRAIAQLEEMTSWSPLQRPGWSCYEKGRRLPKDGKDGNWLATGMLVRAIADTLEILPHGAVPATLRIQLYELLGKEIDSIVDDWQTKRSWFISSGNAITNQWVLPTEGLVRACLVLGKGKHKEAYELGVANLLKALDSHGNRGEFEEGISYAQFTVGSMLAAAHAMAEKGDTRAIRHPFLQNFTVWSAHHMQPGNTVINCFDAVNAGRSTGLLRPLFALSAICTGNPTAIWAMRRCEQWSFDLPMLLGYALPSASENDAPPAYASYERTTRVNWRSSWDEDASGIWVRGGHKLDQHDHQDRGHVSYTWHGKPLLIEAGTSSYDHPSIWWCQSCEGHNVLQIGTQPAKKRPASISVDKLDASGGRIQVNGTQCYNGIDRWTRKVEWVKDSLKVADEVKLTAGKSETVTFRWHLGTTEEVRIKAEGNTYVISWPDGEMTLSGTPDPEITTEKAYDNTLKRDKSNADQKHTCVIVRSRGKVSEFRLQTMVTGKKLQ